MALTKTTLSAAVAASDIVINVTSATGFAAGSYVRLDGEMVQITKSYTSGTAIPVQRGVDGTVSTTHKSGANAVVGLASDFASPPPGLELGITNPITPAIPVFSYSASGAISPVQGIHVLNGTSTLTMTLANPTSDQDGQIMYLIANGKAAHTVTYSAGVGNGGSTMDVGTFNTTEATGCALMAMNGFWILWANGVGSTGTQVAGVVWA